MLLGLGGHRGLDEGLISSSTRAKSMAKLKGPLMSLDAGGSIGSVLTFSSKRSGSQVRRQRAQEDYENVARKAARDPFRWGIELWNYLPADEKAYWTEVERKGYADV